MAETMEELLARVHAATPSGSVKARNDLTAKASLARRVWFDLGEAFGGLFETLAYMLQLGYSPLHGT